MAIAPLDPENPEVELPPNDEIFTKVLTESTAMIDSVLSTVKTAHGVAKYVGLVEDFVEKRLIALANSEFDAGVRALEQAMRSIGERETLLREARNRFNKAIGLETGHRLAMAFLGLAFCHTGLGDTCNANVAMLELATLDPAKFLTFWQRMTGTEFDANLMEIRRAVREYLFEQYRYAVPIGNGEFDFRTMWIDKMQ